MTIYHVTLQSDIKSTVVSPPRRPGTPLPGSAHPPRHATRADRDGGLSRPEQRGRRRGTREQRRRTDDANRGTDAGGDGEGDSDVEVDATVSRAPPKRRRGQAWMEVTEWRANGAIRKGRAKRMERRVYREGRLRCIVGRQDSELTQNREGRGGGEGREGDLREGVEDVECRAL